MLTPAEGNRGQYALGSRAPLEAPAVHAARLADVDLIEWRQAEVRLVIVLDDDGVQIDVKDLGPFAVADASILQRISHRPEANSQKGTWFVNVLALIA